MDLSLGMLVSVARATLAEPRAVARRIIALDLPINAAFTALLLTSVLSALLFHIDVALMSEARRAAFRGVLPTPVGTAIAQALAGCVMAVAMHLVGRWRGGVGTLAQAAILTAWLQFILLLLQVAQILAEIVLPPLADILFLVAAGLSLWLTVHFVMELHGFRSALMTFLGILAVTLVLGMVMLPIYGVPMPPAGGN